MVFVGLYLWWVCLSVSPSASRRATTVATRRRKQLGLTAADRWKWNETRTSCDASSPRLAIAFVLHLQNHSPICEPWVAHKNLWSLFYPFPFLSSKINGSWIPINALSDCSIAADMTLPARDSPSSGPATCKICHKSALHTKVGDNHLCSIVRAVKYNSHKQQALFFLAVSYKVTKQGMKYLSLTKHV